MFHPRQDTSCRGSLRERRAPRRECRWAAGQLLGLSDVVAESEPGAWRAEGGLAGDGGSDLGHPALAVEGLQWKHLVWQPIALVNTVWEVLCCHLLAEICVVWGGRPHSLCVHKRQHHLDSKPGFFAFNHLNQGCFYSSTGGLLLAP